MRIAIISDIHSNIIALQAVMADIKTRSVGKIVCLGDIVGYGPAPNECVETIKQNADICLMGNHDWAVLGKEDLAYFNSFAREAVIWSQKQLSQESENFLRALPFFKVEGECTYVHSSPFEPQTWTYIINKNDAQFQFEHLKTQLCFVGHTHVAGIFQKTDQKFNFLIDEKISIGEGEKLIINVGSIGQPRDFDDRSSYGILDLENKTFEFHRVMYDIKSTQSSMEKFGLPKYLITRLSYGR